MNPKDTVGSQKVSISVIPFNILAKIAIPLMEGARKYGKHNWRSIPIAAGIYVDATLRHLFAWWEGEDLSIDSKIHHIDHAIANLIVMRDAMLHGTLKDDRPLKKSAQDGSWLFFANKDAERIQKMFPECKPPHIEKEKENDEKEFTDAEREKYGYQLSLYPWSHGE
jgi:hypothetical protein